MSTWDEIEDLVDELARSTDPALRRYTLFFRMWRITCHLDTSDPFHEEFSTLSDEAWAAPPDGQADPLSEIMIARVHSDHWAIRGQYRRAAEALAQARHWTPTMGDPDVHSANIASLGVLLTLSGYVTEGLHCISRLAAPMVDFCSQRFIGAGGSLRQHRHVIVELADAHEHSRNYRRAAAGFQLATSLLGPLDTTGRLVVHLALARCLAKIGEIGLAAEVFENVAACAPQAEVILTTKYTRTRMAILASEGRLAEALELCSKELTDEARRRRIALYSELLLDGNAIARQLDEPHWILEHAAGVELQSDDGVQLADTFLCQDLAWAYRRVGHRANAKRCQMLAQQGRSRFHAQSGWSPVDPGEPPDVLVSAREAHRVAARARIAERVSLERGIGSVAHDIRTQLQSLQLLSGGTSWTKTELQTVGSIVTVIDDMLSDLLDDVEAEREFTLTDVPLASVVETVLSRFRSSAAHKQIEVTSSLERTIRCRSDPVALDRIVSNLVSNAIKYSPIGGSVEISATTLGSSFIDLHIIDSGPGIPSDEIEELFRWGGTLSSAPTGSESQQGIGLFTAERLARLTGASIRPHIRSAAQPSTMSVRIPLSRP